jgi:hypothetical protein
VFLTVAGDCFHIETRYASTGYQRIYHVILNFS